MPPIEDMPSTLVKSSSRDARVSCETFSRLESPGVKDAGAVSWKSDEDEEEEEEEEDYESNFGEPKVEEEHRERDHARSKPCHSGKRFFACFSPGTAFHISPRPMMSPGRRGNDFAGIHRAAIPFSGPVTYSGPLGSIPHSGPLKIGGGSVAGHLAPMKVVPKGHSGSFTMMPADVVGKKIPPGYESNEPTSPEVTCIGRVHIKNKHWAKAVEETALKDRRKERFPKKQRQKEKEKKQTESSRRWIWPFTSRKEEKNVPPVEEPFGRLDLRSHGSFSVLPTMLEESQEDRKGFPFKESMKEGESKEALPSMKGEDDVPPPNALLLMKGGSRNWDRPNESGVTPAEEANITTTPVFPHTKNEAPAQEEATRSHKICLHEEKESIWKRRSFAKPFALDVKRDSQMEVGRKQPMTT